MSTEGTTPDAFRIPEAGTTEEPATPTSDLDLTDRVAALEYQLAKVILRLNLAASGLSSNDP